MPDLRACLPHAVVEGLSGLQMFRPMALTIMKDRISVIVLRGGRACQNAFETVTARVSQLRLAHIRVSVGDPLSAQLRDLQGRPATAKERYVEPKHRGQCTCPGSES